MIAIFVRTSMFGILFYDYILNAWCYSSIPSDSILDLQSSILGLEFSPQLR